MLLAALALLSSPPDGDVAPPELLQTLRAFATEEAPRDERYALKLVDLNADGRKEALVLLWGSGWCGTGGCRLLILTPTRGGWRFVTRTTITRTPVRLLPSRHHGWKDLVVRVGGGGLETGNALLRFDGHRYPSNPSMVPTVSMTRPPGTLLIGESNPGRPLFR